MIGIPFIWCSNNLVAAILTQAHLYAEITGDNSYAELEAAHRDWLFGCNPWGTSMIVGLPENGDYPENTHSSYVVKEDRFTEVWLMDRSIRQFSIPLNIYTCQRKMNMLSSRQNLQSIMMTLRIIPQ